LPFKKFKIHAGEQFSEYLNTYMVGRGIPEMTRALKRKFNQSLLEIFQNAAIHSESNYWGIFACGQFYPNKNKLDFTISDAGIGVRENVRRHLNDSTINSINALKWAMTEGNSTKTSGQPGGLGLKFVKDFIRINGGKLHIVSRQCFYEFSLEKEVFKEMEYDFPGTCVNIEINTNDPNSYSLTSELTVADIF
jgi:signal transduction histidine kinase